MLLTPTLQPMCKFQPPSPPPNNHPATWNWVIGDINRKFILVGSAINITIPWKLRPTLVTMVIIYRVAEK